MNKPHGIGLKARTATPSFPHEIRKLRSGTEPERAASEDEPVRDDELVQILEAPLPPEAPAIDVWRILVIDDEEEVHGATRFALADLNILGRRLVLLHAHSELQAIAQLRTHTDIAVILLDVVMDSSDCGLRLVRRIREELMLKEPRIILRTGQPGSAPELEVITNYDINDYRNKNELTATRLITTLTSALRSYEQITALSDARRGLSDIVAATRALLEIGEYSKFASGVLEQLQALLGMKCSGLVATLPGPDAKYPKILGACGRFARQASLSDEPQIRSALLRTLADRLPASGTDNLLCLYVAAAQLPLAVIMELPDGCKSPGRELLDLFATNTRLCADKLTLIAELRDSAFQDPLTGLPNRTHLLDEIGSVLRRKESSYSLALVDVDHFNNTVETLGRERSDELLKAIARRLSDRFSQQEVLVARASGDKFALLGQNDVLAPARLKTLFAVPFLVDSMSLRITATTGLAPVGDPCNSPEAVLSAAYSALKRGKDQQQDSVQVYSAEMSREIDSRVRMLRDLRKAVAREQFHLVLQPQVCLADRKLTGVEALIRWRQEDGTMVPPAEFIPVAESSGLIVPIGAWVFRAACRQLADLQRSGLGELSLAVNVSVAQLRDPTFVRMVESTLADFSVAPRHIELEITESMAIQGIDPLLDMIDQIKDLGIRVALDDFGTGFSSLAHLHRLRIDRLKLDRSFVNEIGQGRRGERIAQAVIELGVRLGLDVIAEGVETEDQARYLKQIGCHEAQGYLFGYPMEPADLASWLARRRDEGPTK